MIAITFLIHTKQPILVTSFQGDPNSDVSYPYIPGSAIRGALIGRYLKLHPSTDPDIVANDRTKKLFFNARTRYLNAYLFTDETKHPRSLPTPKSWFIKKDVELKPNTEIYDLCNTEYPSDQTLKRLGQQFCQVNHNQVTLYDTNKRINIHNQRDRRHGKATEQTGEVFRYEAIDQGQTFQGVILCKESELETIIELLKHDPNVYLGGSISGGYGHTNISHIEKHLTSWNEVGIEIKERLNSSNPNKGFQITLLSDLIFRNSWGQYVIEPPIEILAEELQIDPTLLKCTKSYVGYNLIGGFNRKWGLPLPQIQAISAGSVFEFEYIELNESQIKNLEFHGLGERRVDGFGRVAFNWLTYGDTYFVEIQDKSSSSPIEIPRLQTEDSIIAKQMAERLLRERLDDLLIKQVVDTRSMDLSSMNNNQLSRLMIVAREALSKNNDLNMIKKFFEKLPKKAGNQFEKSGLEKKIKDWIDNPTSWMSKILSITIAGQTCTVTEELAKEYTLRLIMMIAKQARKEVI